MAKGSHATPSKGVQAAQAGPERALEVLTTQADQLSDSERAKWADRLVLRFAPMNASSEANRVLVDELARIQQAVRDLCEERYEAVLERIRPISRRSIFNYWKQFVKGLVAFHSGDHEKARALLGGMPEGSVPANAADAYLELLEVREAASARVCSEKALKLVVGTKAAMTILAAERSWEKGNLRSAYERLSKDRPNFPSDGLDLDGALTEFCFKAVKLVGDRDREVLLEYLEAMDALEKTKSAVESRWALRSLILYGRQTFPPDELEKFLEDFLRVCDQLYGPSARRNAVAYNWLGEVVANFSPPIMPFLSMLRGTRDRQWNRHLERHAKQLFEKSLSYDPDFLAPNLKLCEMHETLGMHSDRNRLLDEMVRRFPGNKEVLLKAGQRCVDRKAFVKGLDYLERARQVDQLDPTIRATLVEARTRLTAQYFQKQKPQKARTTWEGMRGLLVDQPKEFLQSRWAAYARRGVWEELHGDGGEADEWLDASRELSPSNAVFWLFVYFVRSYYLPAKKRADFSNAGKTLMESPTVAEASILFPMLAFWREHLPRPTITMVERSLKDYLSKASRKPFERPELVELLRAVKSGGGFDREVQALISARLRVDPDDPYFRLNLILYKNFRPEYLLSQAQRNEVKRIEEEANRRGDRQALELLGYVKKVMDSMPDFFGSFGMAADLFGVEGDEDDEDDEEGIDPFGGSGWRYWNK